jgi:hypothetical protein
MVTLSYLSQTVANPTCFIRWPRDVSCEGNSSMNGLDSFRPLFSSQYSDDMLFVFDDLEQGGDPEPTAEGCAIRASFWSTLCNLKATSFHACSTVAKRPAQELKTTASISLLSAVESAPGSAADSAKGRAFATPKLTLTLFGQLQFSPGVVDWPDDDDGHPRPTPVPTQAPSMPSSCSDGNTKMAEVDFISGACTKSNIPAEYIIPGNPTYVYTMFHATGTTCEEGGSWGFYADATCSGCPMVTDPNWDFFDPSKTNINCDPSSSNSYPCKPQPPSLKGCYNPGGYGDSVAPGLLGILYFPVPVPTPRPPRQPNEKKWCTNSLHPHNCQTSRMSPWKSCEKDKDCHPDPPFPTPPYPTYQPPPFPTAAPTQMACTKPAYCNNFQGWPGSYSADVFVQLTCAMAAPVKPDATPPKLLPHIRKQGTCQISNITCRQGQQVTYGAGCPKDYVQKSKYLQAVRIRGAEGSSVYDDDDSTYDPSAGIDDDDDDETDSRTSKRPHFKELKCYDPEYRYTNNQYLLIAPRPKYADECFALKVSYIPADLPKGCDIQIEAAGCVRKSHCRMWCTELKSVIDRLRIPGITDNFYSQYRDDDDSVSYEALTFSGLKCNCTHAHIYACLSYSQDAMDAAWFLVLARRAQVPYFPNTKANRSELLLPLGPWSSLGNCCSLTSASRARCMHILYLLSLMISNCAFARFALPPHDPAVPFSQ